jgi:Tfp pilus assembly PilM family ATPase
MFGFFAGKPLLGIEVNAMCVRMALSARKGAGRSVLYAETVDLPQGLVTENYGAPNIADPDELIRLLGARLKAAGMQFRRAALSLPDSIFRVQTLDFDVLPQRHADRERLIRWRLERSAAADLADTTLRYSILKQQGAAVTVLASVAKSSVLLQYERALIALGLEPWFVGLSSFNAQNFFERTITAKPGPAGFVFVTENAFVASVRDADNKPGFYRYKEVKRSGADRTDRLIREIDDSLHFYTHRDRAQTSEVRRLFLAGDPAALDALAGGLSSAGEVVVLSPDSAAPENWTVNGTTRAASYAAALGAGSAQ